MKRIYLDSCCLSRLTDDQSQDSIRREAEAVERLLAGVRRGEVELISSEALEEEVRRNPSPLRRAEAQALLALSLMTIAIDDRIALRGRSLAGLGYGAFDALHLAAAESVDAHVLLSTDDRFLKRVARGVGSPRIPVRNPLSWIEDHGL